MLHFLSKIFIKNYEDTKNPLVRHQYGMLCGIVGMALNFLLFLGKFIAGFLSNSIAITADAFNNLSDAGSSFITLAGFKLASEKPDKNHPYGHGRIEYLAGLMVSFLILMMSLELFKSSIKKIITPEETFIQPLIIAILVVSILAKLYMAFYNKQIGIKIDSAALIATAIDSRNDCISTLLILVGSVISFYTDLYLDGYIGLLVAILIFISGIQAAKDTINPLLGQAPDPEYVQRIEELVTSHDLILGIHDMMIHDYGPGRIMVSLHAEVPANGDILEMHDLIDYIEQELCDQCNCEAIIHMDPISIDDPETNALKEQVSRIIITIDESLMFHDFRIVKGPTHTNILFDVLVPYRFKLEDDELIHKLDTEIKAINQSYFSIIKIDHTYV